MQINRIIQLKVFKYLFLVIALIYSLSFTTWNLCEDNYYYYNQYSSFNENLFQTLYLFIGYLWTSVISDNMLFVNLLGGIFSLVSIFLVYFTFVKKGERIKYLHFLSLGIFLLGEVSCIYNSCPLTTFWFVLIFIILTKRNIFHYRNATIIGIITALSILSRFPNLVLIPFVMFYYIARGVLGKQSSISVRTALYYLLTTLLSYYLLASILCWNLDIISMISSEFTGNEVSSYTTHDIHTLLSNYWESFSTGIFNSSWFLGAIMIAYICGFSNSKNKLLNVVGLLPLIYLIYKNQFQLLGAWYGWRNTLGFLLAYLVIYNAIKANNNLYYLNSILLISIALSLTAGADSGLKNIVMVFETFSPILLIEHKRLLGMTPYKYGIFAVTVTYSSLIYYGQLFFRDFPYDYMNYERATQFIIREKKSVLEQRLAEVDKYGMKDHCIFYGYAGHRIQAISGNKLMYKASYWQKSDDMTETSNIANLMSQDRQCTVFDYNHSEILKQKMEAIGARCISQSEYSTVYQR